MFFFSPELLFADGTGLPIALAIVTAIFGVYILAAGIQGWFYKNIASWYSRTILFVAALLLMLSGIIIDMIALVLVVGVVLIQKYINPPEGAKPSKEAVG